MTNDKVQKPNVGELRQDLITGKWVVVAAKRAGKPNDFIGQRERPKQLPKYKEDCPFCNLKKFPQAKDVLRLPDDADKWQVHIFANKFPAFVTKDEWRTWQVGPYRAIDAVGSHEILATRWHNMVEAELTPIDLALQFEALALRYRQLRERPAVNYIQIIKNNGPNAGASLEHPHQQIFGLPVVPSDVRDMLEGAERYARQQGHEPFGVMLEFERGDGKRIVFENDRFTAFCPWASRFPFEVWVVPRKHEPYFENINREDRRDLSEVMWQVLKRLRVGLKDPAYNYYIYSAPCDEGGLMGGVKSFENWRWHIEIVPRIGDWGGLEVGTGLEITTAWPRESAAWLRNQTV